jgi:transposase
VPIAGGLDIHRKQLTFEYLDTVTGQVMRGQVAPGRPVQLAGSWKCQITSDGRPPAARAADGR